jgi:hypothetical protein
MTVIYSNKEIELFNRLGCDWYSQAEPPVVYSTLCINVFLENINDEAAESLRRCMKAMEIDGPPYRLTKEFDDLIVLNEQEKISLNSLNFIIRYCGFNNLTIAERVLIANYEERRINQYSELLIPQARLITLCYLLYKVIFTDGCIIGIFTKKSDVIKSILAIFKQLPKSLQPKIITKYDNRIEFENGSLIDVVVTTNFLRGRNYDITFIDNVFKYDNIENRNFMDSVYPTIVSSKNQKLFIGND